jgi:predicted DsbA family dithiol-disulfide isomerase
MTTSLTPTQSAKALEIDIASDIVCPWCYIGKRRLESALSLWQTQYPERPTPTVRWLPFQLNPDMPLGGMSRADYLMRKFGSADGGSRYDRVRQEGKNAGLPFAFERMTVQPNTLKAHALVAVALGAGVQSQVKEALMKAYFCEGTDLTQDTELLRIAVQAGLPEATAKQAIGNSETQQSIAEQDAHLRSLGIQGVPFFIINQKYGVSGAQSPESLLEAFEQAVLNA